MKQRELREKMPTVAEWIDEMCEAFGKEHIHGQIRRGINGEPTFYAEENGYAVGTPIPRGKAIVWHPVTGLAMDLEAYKKELESK